MSQLPVRMIPRLDVKNNTVVKGIHLEGLRVVGNPVELAVKYYQEGADEILYMDAVASLYERNSLLPIVKDTAKSVFIPMTVGGGVRTLDDIRNLLNAGADKVAINTAAIKRPEFIREASHKYGSQCIVLSIEAKKLGSKWEAYMDTGREATGVDVLEWAEKAVSLGAGEILITSIDHEGMKKGFDIDLIQEISKRVEVPLIACGGAGNSQHVIEAIQSGHADAVACASLFHYNLEHLSDVKNKLHQAEIPVRLLGRAA
ncbi:MAG: imidazole glycerol phosphate synthase subunit HisF [Deltaproteobacteria bacterium]|nr:MAG: imidazole glycerol phosphate synthase subunit HisF [Deltaproteobacteria bacterium]